MNWLDAQLTLLWIHLNVASEGNGLMASILRHGPLLFVTFQLLIGGFAAYILYRCSHLSLAKHGLTVVLVIYLALMVIHAATGCAALGWQGPLVFMGFLAHLPLVIASMFS